MNHPKITVLTDADRENFFTNWNEKLLKRIREIKRLK